MRSRLLFILLPALFASPVIAQDDHSHHDMQMAAPVSDAARRDIAGVEKAMQPLASTTAAQGAGYVPILGWIPTMGVHWVNAAGMRAEKRFEMNAPNQLMFSRIAGKDSLVGAAYAYFAPASDTARPSTFPGNPSWHEHADLAPPGQTLVMLHVWFVPSPDGPFAGTNPNLPFWAVGLRAPDAKRMEDHEFAERARRAALALAEVADTNGIFPTLRARPALHALLGPKRDSVRAEIVALRSAEDSKNVKAYDAALAETAGLWDSMYADYTASITTRNGKARVERYARMLLGEHAH